jgi:uncharacterized protein YndB with AHSA1/START domain
MWFLEVEPPRRLVYDHGDFEKPWFHVTVEFEDLGNGRTSYRAGMVFDSVGGLREREKKYGSRVIARPTRGEGLPRDPAMNRRKHAFQRQVDQAQFLRHRARFDFDPSQVYRAWVDPAAKARWFNGPADKWTEAVREMDVRVGGRDGSSAKFVDGSESRFEAQYFDVVPEKRLVYTYDMYWQGKKISVSLASDRVRAGGKGTKLVLTEQHAFLDGTKTAAAANAARAAHGQSRRGARRRRHRAAGPEIPHTGYGIQRADVRRQRDHVLELEFLDTGASAPRLVGACAFLNASSWRSR